MSLLAISAAYPDHYANGLLRAYKLSGLGSGAAANTMTVVTTVEGLGFRAGVQGFVPSPCVRNYKHHQPHSLASLLQQPGPKKFKLSKIELIYKAKKFKVPLFTI